MQPTHRPRIKICCISSVEEAWTAVRHGASALGLVEKMGAGPGCIEDELIAEIAAHVPPGIATVLLTNVLTADEIVDRQRRSRVNTLQLVDDVPVAEYAAMREAMPGVAIIQVVHVSGPHALDRAREVAPHVNAILLDSKLERDGYRQLGGTGLVHDWDVSARIREAVDVPLFLAGGLRPDNAAEAVARVAPFGLDVCTGVRSDGQLDPDKLQRFMAAARPAA